MLLPIPILLHKNIVISSQLWMLLSQWQENGVNGTWTLISAMPVQCSTSWTIRPIGSWLLCGSMISQINEIHGFGLSWTHITARSQLTWYSSSTGRAAEFFFPLNSAHNCETCSFLPWNNCFDSQLKHRISCILFLIIIIHIRAHQVKMRTTLELFIFNKFPT